MVRTLFFEFEKIFLQLQTEHETIIERFLTDYLAANIIPELEAMPTVVHTQGSQSILFEVLKNRFIFLQIIP